MFFVLSKVLWFVFSPLSVLTIGLCAGVFFYARTWAKWLIRFCVACLALIGFLPIGYNLLTWLENKYPAVEVENVDGIIVLGGGLDLKTSNARQQIQINVNANRIWEFAALSLRYPQAKLVVTGGEAEFIDQPGSEAEKTREALNILNIKTDRIVIEAKSRNTYENMQFSKELIHPQPGDKWLLITSAYHMPRSMAIFNTNGWKVMPHPAGYITNGQYRYLPTLDVLGSFYQFQVAVKEIVGIIAYTLTDRIKTDIPDADNAITDPVPDTDAAPAAGGVR